MKCTNCGRLIVPVVALDIDGVLGEYHDHLLHFMDAYFGRRMPRGWNGTGDWEDFLNLSQAEYREAKLAFRQGGMKRTMPVRDGAFELAFLATQHGAEVWITTTRPWNRLDSVDPDTREWLRRNNIYYDHLLYDDNKYVRLAQIVGCERVAFVLDDLPEMWQEAEAHFPQRSYLLMRAHNVTADEKVRRLANLQQAAKVMTENINQWKGMAQ